MLGLRCLYSVGYLHSSRSQFWHETIVTRKENGLDDTLSDKKNSTLASHALGRSSQSRFHGIRSCGAPITAQRSKSCYRDLLHHPARCVCLHRSHSSLASRSERYHRIVARNRLWFPHWLSLYY